MAKRKIKKADHEHSAGPDIDPDRLASWGYETLYLAYTLQGKCCCSMHDEFLELAEKSADKEGYVDPNKLVRLISRRALEIQRDQIGHLS